MSWKKQAWPHASRRYRFASSRIREKGFLISDEPGIDNEIFTDEPITPIQGPASRRL
jgi:hypothetical protein